MDSNLIHFVMVGGFLGAGKTTTIARLAAKYVAAGKRVGIVTNDQAADLVDTFSLRQQGYDVREVAGACFCCHFNDLIDKVGQFDDTQRPDVILAEPVGSCTDLVATVIQPLKQLYGARFHIAPYGVLLKPSHGLRILRGEAGAGFSPKAAYIFKKQLEEADAILINRMDELTAKDADELATRIAAINSDALILRVSAKTGQGFDAYEALLEQRGAFGRRILDIDYDIYAEGEAELGWLNSSSHITATRPFAMDRLLFDVIASLRESLGPEGAEVAHLKVIGLWEGFFGVANLVSSHSEAELSLPSHSETSELDLIINARVAIDPEILEKHVQSVVKSVSAAYHANAVFRASQSFRPGRPVPTHRLAATE